MSYDQEYYIKNKERIRANVKAYRLANLEMYREKDRIRGYDHHLKRRYKITIADYQIMYSNQKGLCAICGVYKLKLRVDHCHATNKVRGLLCDFCNTRLPILERPGLLEKAQAYLQR